METTTTFDKPVYAPGDLITATVRVTGLTGPVRIEEAAGELRLSDGTSASFIGEMRIQGPPPQVTSGVMAGGDRVWTLADYGSDFAIFTATA
jgi:hypothetical protein